MAQGFTPYSGGSFGNSPGDYSGAGSGASTNFAGGSSFSTTSTSGKSAKATSAPTLRLLPSFILGIIGVVLNAVITFGSHVATDTSYAVLAVLAWFLAGVLGISLLGWYFTENSRRKSAGSYFTVGWKKTLYWSTVALLLIAVVWSAVDIAQWAGKL